MKLLYITNGINGAGGLERVLSIKASYLADEYDYKVTILALNGNDQNPFYDFSPKITTLSISVVGGITKYISSYVSGIRKAINIVDPDIILVCDDGLKGFFVPLITKSRKPIIYERHVSKEIEFNDGLSPLKRLGVRFKWSLMEYMARSFSKFVVLTEGNRKEWPSLKNMIVVANPLSFYPVEKSTLKNKQVIAVGKQGFQKGYDRLLNSWQLVQQKHPEWRLTIYGKEDPESQLNELAKQLGISNSVYFYPPEKDIQSKYLESSIYVMSSRFEGFGMVLIEAMACGVPSVAFDCNYGPADIIENGKDGYIVKNGDVATMADRIIKLIEEDEVRLAMGSKAKENVQRFLPEIIVKQWDKLFKSLVS